MLYLYRHIRLDTNVPFYIGIGSYRKNRSDTHERAYAKKDRSKFWHRVTSKTDYRVEIMLEDLTREVACEKEREFILLYGRRDVGTGTLVNMTDGGDGVFNLSPESRKVMSEKAKILSKGRTHSQETKDKLSLIKLNAVRSIDHKLHTIESLRPTWESNKIKIERFDLLTGQTLQSYNSLRDAEYDGYNLSTISEVINGKRWLRSHKGFGWRRAGVEQQISVLSNDI